MGSLRVVHDWVTSLSHIGEGNSNPLQCSCLENPRDGGAWWAAVSGVTQSRTRLKRLSSSSSSFKDGHKKWSLAFFNITDFKLFNNIVVGHLCPTLHDPMDCSMPCFPVLQHLLEFTHAHAHWIDDAIQLSHALSSPSPPAFNPSQHQGQALNFPFIVCFNTNYIPF